MGKNFWLKFAIEEALVVAGALLNSTNLTPEQKTDLQALIMSGQKVLADF